MTMTEPAHAALPVFPDENLLSDSLAKHAAAMGQDTWLIADATQFGLEPPDLDDLGLRPLSGRNSGSDSPYLPAPHGVVE